MKRLYITAILAAATCLYGAIPAHAVQTPPPNVLLIVSDDQGTLDLHSYGADDLHTPHLDALARRGVRFTQFYAAAPICSPARGAILTGRYPQRNGVIGNSDPLNENEVTIAEMLKAAGYRTGQFGKWHIGHGRPDDGYAQAPGPNQEGFEYAIGFLGGVVDQWSHFNYGGDPWGDPPRRHDLHKNGKEIWRSGTHAGDLIVDETIAFMTRHQEEPFFAYAAFGAPHYPLHAYDKHMALYEHLPMQRRQYAAYVSTLDEQIGRLLAGVDDLGLRENMIIIFMSDHGHSTESRANYGGGYAGPYRGNKGSLFEAGIRVPAFISYPGHIPAGASRDQVATGMDWLPTIADYTKTTTSARLIDGHSLRTIIEDEQAGSLYENVFWHRPGNLPQWAVREGYWKLVVNARDARQQPVSEEERIFLSNLALNVSERHNQASIYPEIVERLTNKHAAWLKDIMQVEK